MDGEVIVDSANAYIELSKPINCTCFEPFKLNLPVDNEKHSAFSTYNHNCKRLIWKKSSAKSCMNMSTLQFSRIKARI